MERQIEGVVTGVEMRDVRRKSDNQQFTMYEVSTQQGMKATTTKRDLAEQAFDLKGQKALLMVKEVPKGEYTNYYLQAVYPSPGLKSLQEASSQALGSSENFKAPSTMFEPPLPSPAPPAATRDIPEAGSTEAGSTEKDLTIWRQTAAKVSAQISNTADEFWANLDQLVRYFDTGSKPNDQLDMAPAGASDAPDDGIPF